MSTQGSGSPGSYFARKVLGDAVNALLDYFHRQTESGLADTGTATLLGGEEVHAVAVIVDKTNNLTALVELQGDGGATAILAQSGTHFNTTAGNAGTVNVYYDTDHYEVENQTTAEADLEVLAVRAP